MYKEKIKQIFSERSEKLKDHDPWRYGDDLSEFCDNIELLWINQHIVDGSILDLGCGTGRHLISLALSRDCKNSYTGVDIAPNNINILNDKSKNLNLNITAINDDVCNFLTLKNEINFDTIIGIGIVQYILDDLEVCEFAKNCYNILNNHGRLLLKIPISFEKTYLYDGYSEFLKSKYISKYRSFNDIINLFSKFFDILKIERVFLENKLLNNFNIVETNSNLRQMWFEFRKKNV